MTLTGTIEFNLVKRGLMHLQHFPRQEKGQLSHINLYKTVNWSNNTNLIEAKHNSQSAIVNTGIQFQMLKYCVLTNQSINSRSCHFNITDQATKQPIASTSFMCKEISTSLTFYTLSLSGRLHFRTATHQKTLYQHLCM